MSKNNLTFWQEAVESLDGGNEWNDATDNKPEGWATDSTDAASTGWTDGGGDAGNTELTDVELEESTLSDEEETAFWESALEDDEYEDSDFGSHGEFIKPKEPTVDETEPQIKPETDNYETDPADDKGADDLMKDDNSTVNVEIESFFLI